MTLPSSNLYIEESDTLTQLYTKLHDKVATEIGSPEIAELVKKTMRSSSGAIAAINEMRGRLIKMLYLPVKWNP